MGSAPGKLLSTIAVPICVLALIGTLLSCLGGGTGGGRCPIDPLDGKPACSRFTDHESWSRATVAEMEARK